ncbi:hypothetical protein JXA40_05035 [bacterium]|nr:hypothetical protein [candidate division CSSED10-310 bacterium]
MKTRLAYILPIILLPWLTSASTPDQPPESVSGYGLVMSNGMKLKVTGYMIDLERETITYKSNLSGLTATFPLERLKEVVRFNPDLNEIPEDAQVVYVNPASLSDVVDDGGIPIVFKVKAINVGGGTQGWGTASGAGTSRQSYRSNYTGGTTRSGSGSYGSSSGSTAFGTAGSRAGTNYRSSVSGSSASGSGSTDAEDFFTKIFGGNR